MEGQVAATQHQLQDIERVQHNAKILRNKADWITQSIQNFAGKYISQSGWLNASGSCYSSQVSVRDEHSSESTIAEMSQATEV